MTIAQLKGVHDLNFEAAGWTQLRRRRSGRMTQILSLLRYFKTLHEQYMKELPQPKGKGILVLATLPSQL